MSGENRFQGPGPLRPANDRAREPYPQPTAAEPTEQGASPASFDELEFPDQIALERAGGQSWAGAVEAAGLPSGYPEFQAAGPIVVHAAIDTWYAGVPRGDRLVLRRI